MTGPVTLQTTGKRSGTPVVLIGFGDRCCVPSSWPPDPGDARRPARADV